MKLVNKLILIAALLFILVVAAISIPSLHEDRVGGNEAMAIGGLRMIGHAQNRHFEGQGRYASLAELGKAGLIDAPLSAGQKSGYAFTITLGKGAWAARAEPLAPGDSGVRRFFTDPSLIVRFDPQRRATADSPSIQGPSIPSARFRGDGNEVMIEEPRPSDRAARRK